ncbi:hypothetical protein [Symbiopectobacterium sp. RP]|uniref:hypothetical protein n=1 Tax=Symbiopectobacterium sp. RP TaxID=3248553 RepID=UPI003D2C6893
MGTSKKQKKKEWLRYRDFVLSLYGVIKIKSLGYTSVPICMSSIQRINTCPNRIDVIVTRAAV